MFYNFSIILLVLFLILYLPQKDHLVSDLWKISEEHKWFVVSVCLTLVYIFPFIEIVKLTMVGVNKFNQFSTPLVHGHTSSIKLLDTASHLCLVSGPIMIFFIEGYCEYHRKDLQISKVVCSIN